MSATSYLIIGLLSLGLMVGLVQLAVKLFPKWGLMDRPKKYGLKRKPIPYPGGILIYVGFIFLVPVFLYLTGAQLDSKLISLIIGASILALVSFIDDRINLPASFRLFIQILVAIIMVFGGIGVEGITNPFGGTIDLSERMFSFGFLGLEVNIMVFSALLTIFWLLLVINTMNWLDGIPGLTSGMSGIGCLIIFFLSISDLVNQPEVATLALIIGILAFGFWLFDFFPPKIIIGDTGSMFLGLMLATLAIFSGGKIATAFLVLGFPILDTLYVTLYRISKKQAPWKGGEWDKDRKAVHLHHRLLEFGFSERQVLLFVYFISTVFGLAALFLKTRGKLWAIGVLVLLSVILSVVLRRRKK